MKLVIPDSDSNYRVSNTDYCWTEPGEILTVGSHDAFVGVDSGRYTTRGRVADLDLTRDAVTEKIIRLLTRGGWYEPGRDRQRPETRKRMQEAFGLARGFEIGTVLELHHGRPRLAAA